MAEFTAKKSQAHQKHNYDLRSRGGTVQVGDRVLVKVVAHDGRHKIADKWEQDPYHVIRQPNSEIPVFVVQREDGSGPERILHRNLLLPIGQLPISSVEEQQELSRSVDKVGQIPQPNEETMEQMTPEFLDQEDTSDEEDIVLITQVKEDHPDGNSESNVHEETPQTAAQRAQEPQRVQQATPEEAHEVLPTQAPVQERPIPQPRRSTRVRQQPAWMRSGDYAFSSQVVSSAPDWMQRANFLSSMIHNGTINPSEDVSNALLKIVSGN